ncbi:DUF6776 family protein [Candidimonas nitroreducens]|uniref:Uncharacterized protein n=1 Tax=Candidimonas nitroreducens TaxID=683354 RepID=A0A225MHP2_9BURK|nr:DUF6776 family protein [Candidimonas nitroreducens]OWT60412.1 hypothetical protein CEY11_11905 [Candidimonas nitroreducens]
MPGFGSSKRPAFKPTAYGSTRRTRRVPRWLVLLLTGVVLGAGGLLFLQKNYGPPRLTVEQSEQLHNDLNNSNLDKQRLQSQLNQATRDLSAARSKIGSLTTQVQQAQAQVAKTASDLQLFVNAMPPGPRGTSPGIRSAAFENNAGNLDYQILIMQDPAKKIATYQGTLELVVAGNYTSGKHANITLPIGDTSLQQYVFVRGSVQLPDGFSARQVTIRLTDGNKRLSATRTLRVSR